MKCVFRTGRAGLTLVEILISMAVLSIAMLGLAASFKYVQQGIQLSKNKTLASNLAQEKMQILRQQTYFRLLPTVNPSTLSDGTPYDNTTFLPETVMEGGVPFIRYTYVQVVTEDSGALVIQPPATPDTGMRQITVTVAWTEGGVLKHLSINSVMSNPNTVESNSVFTGTVKNATTNAAIPNAVVDIAENVGWRDTADTNGIYNIRLSPGSFNLVATAKGYFSGYTYQSVSANTSSTVNFLLTPMSVGTVSSTAVWMNPGVVISQVVVSTVQAGGYDAEYVELFNPTTNTITVPGSVNLNYVSDYNNTSCTLVPLVYIHNTIPVKGYFLIASTGNFMINGAVVIPDAYYSSTANASCTPSAFSWNAATGMDIMARGYSGSWWLTNAAGTTLDSAGWSKGGVTHSPSHCAGTCYSTTSGIPSGSQLVRASSTAGQSSAYGKAYKSGSNAVDFALSTLSFWPYTSLSAAQSVIAGVPAVGAVISANDGLADPVTATASGSPPVASFSLPNVATGTWRVLITSGSYELENDTVPLLTNGSTYVFTAPTMLSTDATKGFITGQVLNAFGAVITSSILVNPGGVSVDTTTGRYFLSVTPGFVDVTVNPNFVNSSYISLSSAAVVVKLGQVTDGLNFILSQGGRITGFVTRDGTNGIQGVAVAAIDGSGNVQDQEVTNTNGYFTTTVISTGAYTMKVQLDSTEASSPTANTVSLLTLGQNVFSTTFTITGALGTVTGSVTASGSPIATGVMLVAVTSTSTVPSGAPPAISSTSLNGAAIYVTSSREDGTYSMDLRQSTSYYLYAFYPSVSSAGVVTTSTKTLSAFPIVSGQTVTGKNFAW